MYVRFWGVRGSIPTPLSSTQIQSKIAAAVQRISPEDLLTPETRESFIASLPPDIMGTVGGNTTCIETRLEDDTIIVFDAGSGIRRLGGMLKTRREYRREYHIFFTHFHWDHIHGLPFFAPQAFDPGCTITFYSPVENLRQILEAQMQLPYFPITMKDMKAQMKFVHLKDMPYEIGRSKVYWRSMKHPGGCFSYKIVEDGRQFVFSTDTELTESDFIRTPANSDFYQGVNLLILDTQYTLDEAIEKYDWGHSSYSLAVDFAAEWDVEKLVLFHHEPSYEDAKMYGILKSAKWYLRHLDHDGLSVYLAREEMEIRV